MLNLCIVNSWLLYRATTIADCSIPLAELKLDVAIELLKNENQMTNIYLQFMMLKFTLHGISIESLNTIWWFITSPRNYRILRIYNDASMNNAKENEYLRVKNLMLFCISQFQIIKKTAFMHFTINNLIFVLAFVCSSIVYDSYNKYIFIVYIHTLLGFVNILASGNHDVHYNGHFETPPPPPQIFFKKVYIQKLPQYNIGGKK